MSTEQARKETMQASSSLIVDIGPVAVFFLTYVAGQRFAKDEAIYYATGAFMVAMIAALIYAKLRQGRIPAMLVVSTVLVLLFGGLTLALRDPVFIKTKPTVINALYGFIILGSLAFGVNVWRLLFRHAFTLPERIWWILAVRWALFFFLLAGLNEYIHRAYSEEIWVTYKTFQIGIFLAFAALNLPITFKYMGQTDTFEEEARAKAADTPDGDTAEPEPQKG